MAPPPRNPKDSMQSTWRQDKSQWGIAHYILDILNVHQSYIDKTPPVHSKTDKVPYLPNWLNHRQAIIHALLPLLLHQWYCSSTHQGLSWTAALFLYTLSFKLCGIHQLSQLRRLGQQFGFFDGDNHTRDGVPDHSVDKVLLSMINTATFRSVALIFLTYRRDQAPIDLNWKFILLEVSLYGIILDFWFYWYHRLMHEHDSLWQFHRTHHLTKHPNPLLTLYADQVQEFFDIIGIPLFTYGTMKLMGLPLGFYDWWICHMYIMFTELSGHSGIRMHASPPSPVLMLLQYFDCELVIEDHDLHHRQGWKKSGNYGKQTRLWDRIFGTCLDRIECSKENVDWDRAIRIPVI